MAVLCVHGHLLVLAVALPLCNAAGLESPVLQYAICKIGHNPFSFSVLMEMGCSTESQEQKPKREKEHYSKLNWVDVAEVTLWVSGRRNFSDDQDLSEFFKNVISFS